MRGVADRGWDLRIQRPRSCPREAKKMRLYVDLLVRVREQLPAKHTGVDQASMIAAAGSDHIGPAGKEIEAFSAIEDYVRFHDASVRRRTGRFRPASVVRFAPIQVILAALVVFPESGPSAASGSKTSFRKGYLRGRQLASPLDQPVTFEINAELEKELPDRHAESSRH